MLNKTRTIAGSILATVVFVLLIRGISASNSDLIDWYRHESGTFADFFAVTRGSDLFVAVGQNGKIATYKCQAQRF